MFKTSLTKTTSALEYQLNNNNKGGLTLLEIYIGFCPYIDFHNIIHNDCLTYYYSICDIVSHLPIYMVKK